MIKCIGYLKSLKQLLFTLLISCFIFGLGSFVNGFDLTNGIYVRQNGDYGFSPYNLDYNVNVVSKGNLLTDYIGQSVKAIYLRDGTYFTWKYSDYLGGIAPFISVSISGNNLQYQGFPYKYAICNEFDGQNHIEDYSLTGCNVYDLYSGSLTTINNFMSSVSNTDTFGFVYKWDGYSDLSRNIAGALFCFSSSSFGRSMCFGIGPEYKSQQIIIYPGYSLGYSNLFSYSGYGVSLPYSYGNLFSSNLDFSPGGSGNNNNSGSVSPDGVELSSTQGALDYYENYYGWNSDICYLGVDSMTYLWGASGVSFNQGGGLSIFEGFEELYSGSDFDHVYVWVNSWLINYNNWFNRSDPSESPLYLVNYDYNNNSVNIYYDNLNFPFSNNPLGVYFMTNYIDSKSSLCDSSCGSDVVSYCNIKLNGGTFEDIIDNSSKESINQYVAQKNIHNGLNSDGTNKTHTYFYTSSGEDYTGAVEFINYYVGQLNGLINTNYDGPGFIPAYIILFMLALIFFRFISH